jgi:hypothetical protein
VKKSANRRVHGFLGMLLKIPRRRAQSQRFPGFSERNATAERRRQTLELGRLDLGDLRFFPEPIRIIQRRQSAAAHSVGVEIPAEVIRLRAEECVHTIQSLTCCSPVSGLIDPATRSVSAPCYLMSEPLKCICEIPENRFLHQSCQ